MITELRIEHYVILILLFLLILYLVRVGMNILNADFPKYKKYITSISMIIFSLSITIDISNPILEAEPPMIKDILKWIIYILITLYLVIIVILNLLGKFGNNPRYIIQPFVSLFVIILIVLIIGGIISGYFINPFIGGSSI